MRCGRVQAYTRSTRYTLEGVIWRESPHSFTLLLTECCMTTTEFGPSRPNSVSAANGNRLGRENFVFLCPHQSVLAASLQIRCMLDQILSFFYLPTGSLLGSLKEQGYRLIDWIFPLRYIFNHLSGCCSNSKLCIVAMHM